MFKTYEFQDVTSTILASTKDRVLICGDLNAPGHDDCSINPGLQDAIETLGLKQHVKSPTRNGPDHLLDYIILTGGTTACAQDIRSPVYIHGAQRNVLVITIYRPGSEEVSAGFFREFSDILECTATFSCPMIILGDVNFHLDDANNPHTIHFNAILEQFCLVQHVHSITHNRRHTLDVVITRLEHPVQSVHVEPPVLLSDLLCYYLIYYLLLSAISDHAFIVADIDLKIVHDQPNSVVRRRQWRKVDFEVLREDLRRSSLLTDPPSGVAELFSCYDETLKSLVDKHAPFVDVKLHVHPNAPWYDSRCQVEKVKTRRLENAYRREKSEELFKAWRSQSQYLRFVLREQYTEYWSRTLSSNMKDPAALWSKIGVLLNQPNVTSDCKFSPDEFADFFSEQGQQNSPVHVKCQPTSDRAQAVSSPIRLPTRNNGGDLKDRRCITCETLHAGPSSNMAHQTTGAGPSRNNHENV